MFVFGFQILVFDCFGDVWVQCFVFQIIVDVFVGDIQGYFIWQGGVIVFQVGGGQFFIQMFWVVEMGQQLFVLMFVQVENWVDVGVVVVIFGEKVGNCFCCMVGIDYNFFGYFGDVVLGFYLFMGFFIFVNEVVQFDVCFVQCLFVGQYCSFNIDC